MKMRNLIIRLSFEWRRLGGAGRLLGRLVEIHRSEGWSGIRKRIQSLMAGKQRDWQITRSLRNLWKAFTGQPNRSPDAVEPGVLLIGHPYGILGVGENLRSSAIALDKAGIPFAIGSTFEPSAQDMALLEQFPYREKLKSLSALYRTNLFCLNANEMDLALVHLGPEIFEKSYCIACWVWELLDFPKKWIKNFRYVQEIWAQSRFIQESIARKSPVPVIWMPQVVEPGPADPTIAHALGVPEDRFSFLFFFDFTSYINRKNPWAVIEAFRMAFSDVDQAKVNLVLKMNGMQHRPQDYHSFLSRPDLSDPRIVLIDRVLSDREIKGLISGCDVFVSLHRSEGFGRGIAEAMYYGKAVIATGYSGNTDFANHSNSCVVDYSLIPVRQGEYPFWKGQFWAEPDIEHAALWMRQLYEDRSRCQAIGSRAAESIRLTHGAAAVGRRMRNRLDRLGML